MFLWGRQWINMEPPGENPCFEHLSSAPRIISQMSYLNSASENYFKRIFYSVSSLPAYHPLCWRTQTVNT
jgi:hypothetical protein